MLSDSYQLHGLAVTVCAEKRILAAVQSRLGRFAVATAETPGGLHFDFQPVSELSEQGVEQPAGRSRPVFDLGWSEVHYFFESQQLYMEIPDRALAMADLRTGQVLVSYLESEGRDPWLVSHPFVTVPLCERLKSLGIYAVHAAGLAIDGHGLLIPGASGSGKTTLTIALLRAGFQFLGDDTVFLAPDLRVLAFPDEVDVTATTASFFPELAEFTEQHPRGQRPKRACCPMRLFGTTLCWECAPEVLVFPQPAASGRSTLTPLSKAEALIELCGNVVRTEARSSQAHLDTLAALVERCRCHRLQTGLDFDLLAARLKSILLTPEC